jgi:hypothetical protein
VGGNFAPYGGVTVRYTVALINQQRTRQFLSYSFRTRNENPEQYIDIIGSNCNGQTIFDPVRVFNPNNGFLQDYRDTVQILGSNACGQGQPLPTGNEIAPARERPRRTPYNPLAVPRENAPQVLPPPTAPTPDPDTPPAPTTWPQGAPQDAPEAPAPGPSLPQGDPLQTPKAPEPPTDPGTPPQATPENTPSKRSGTLTGAAIAAAIAAGIGGAVLLNGKRIGDATTPGEFTQEPPPPPNKGIPSPPNTGCRCNAGIVGRLDELDNKLDKMMGNNAGLIADGGIFAYLQRMQAFAEKAWEATRIQKVLDLLTFIAVLHNVSMLSRDIGETFFYLVAQGLDIVGIENEEGGPLDVGQIVGGTVNNFLISIFGEAFVEGARDSYRKANRIVQSASMVIWTVRSIQDSSLDLMEWIGENTGKIGNALKRFGVVGDRSYPWMAESAQARAQGRARFSKVTDALENAEDRLSSYSIATSNVLEIQQETQELGENWGRFKESLNDIPDPWFNNQPVETAVAAETEASASPTITAADAER